jgi:ACT domain-containing protein
MCPFKDTQLQLICIALEDKWGILSRVLETHSRKRKKTRSVPTHVELELRVGKTQYKNAYGSLYRNLTA